jgi:diacylglycerol kinase
VQGPTRPRLFAITQTWRRTANVFESFFHAFRGFWVSLKTERNLRIHVAVALLVAAAGVILKVDTIGWTLLVLSCGVVIVAELANTALERLVDLATEGKFNRLAGEAKDISAAAVMSAAVMAAIIGALVFLPRIALLLHI